MSRNAWILLGLVVGTAFLGIYLASSSEPVETMGEADSTLTLKDWLTFGGMALGFGTAIVNLMKSIIDAYAAASRNR